MGFVLSKFRKEKSTTAVLEGLQVQIQELEKYVINTQERKRRFVTNFVGFTIGVYIVGFALWYFFYFPPTMQERIMYLVPLLLFPVLIVFLRQMFTWYFQRKLNKNGDKLKQLKEKKSKILEQVMDKETYKVAVNLLERFGDKQQNRMLGTVRSAASSTSLNKTTALQRTPQQAAGAAQQRQVTPYSGVYRNMNNNLNSSVMAPMLQVQPSTPQGRTMQELRRRTPFPIVDESKRSALDRIVDFLVGDSPQNRYAMICKECHRHNGMLPVGDYEYTTFHCAFCNVLNPARKERPVAPRLSLEAAHPQTPQSTLRNDSSDSDSSDDEDEDYENKLSTRRALHDDLPMTDNEADTKTEAATNSGDDASTTATKVEETDAATTAAASVTEAKE
ncbi:endoplasmic reticulum junction formation protein lunapark-B [Drosophila sulfurigaster albostrigata]|uniref:endoplasmic reticulum junction formation protein lunapark-B n=1 Tax=Drosophila sulfurigaster albostrigata TaxID=89887 RepID=UPI002D21DF05|nr:endoplasmic reticulum junction formation protein lunapark-B [Drosophila sulfurigaster albostrigata]